MTGLVSAVAVLGIPAAALARSAQDGVGAKRFYKLQRQALSDRTAVEVNVVSGNLLVHTSVLRLVGTAGLNLGVDRYYNSMVTGTVLDMGPGWSTSTGANVQLISDSTGDVTYFDPTGASWTFTPASSGGYTPPSGLDADLTKNSNGTYALFFHHGADTLNFGVGGHITSEQDHQQSAPNTISFKYTTVNGAQ